MLEGMGLSFVFIETSRGNVIYTNVWGDIFHFDKPFDNLIIGGGRI